MPNAFSHLRLLALNTVSLAPYPLLMTPSIMTSHWILGPGAIGRLLAHALSPLAAVTLIGRRPLPGKQTLTTPEGGKRAHILNTLTVDQLASATPEPPAFVHITTKAMAAEAALESIASAIPSSTPLVLWQNGFWRSRVSPKRGPGRYCARPPPKVRI